MNVKERKTLLKLIGCNDSGAQNILNHIHANANDKVIGTMIEHYADVNGLYASSFNYLNFSIAKKAIKEYTPGFVLIEAWHQLHGLDYDPVIPDLIKR